MYTHIGTLCIKVSNLTLPHNVLKAFTCRFNWLHTVDKKKVSLILYKHLLCQHIVVVFRCCENWRKMNLSTGPDQGFLKTSTCKTATSLKTSQLLVPSVIAIFAVQAMYIVKWEFTETRLLSY